MISAEALLQNLIDGIEFRTVLCQSYPLGQCCNDDVCPNIHYITGDRQLLEGAFGVDENLAHFAMDPRLNRPKRQLFARPSPSGDASPSQGAAQHVPQPGLADGLMALAHVLQGNAGDHQQVPLMTGEPSGAAGRDVPADVNTEHDEAIAEILQQVFDELNLESTRRSTEAYTRPTCVICLEQSATMGLMHGESMHVCCCQPCARRVVASGRGCPICRQSIERVVKRICCAGAFESWRNEVDQASVP